MTADSKINISRAVNLLYLAYIVIWPAFGRLVVQVDGAGRIGMFLLILVIFFNFSKLDFWRSLSYRPITLWLIWCVYVSSVWLWKGLPPLNNVTPFLFIYTEIFSPFFAMWVISYEVRRKAKPTVIFLCLAFLTYMLLGVLLQQGAKLYNGRVSGGLWNNMPLTSLSFMAVVVIANIKGWLSTKWVVMALLLSIIATLMVATRKAFIGIGIIIIFWYISANNVKKASSIIMAVLVVLVAFFGISYIFDNTVLGERFSLVENQGKALNKSGYELLNFLGDRATFYIEGWKLFKSYPFFGIGLSNYKTVLPSDMPIHSEFMVQLAEGGLIGALLFLLFHFSLFRRIFSMKKENNKSMKLTLCGIMICILFIGLTAWTYSMRAYYIVFGAIIGLSTSQPLVYDADEGIKEEISENATVESTENSES